MRSMDPDVRAGHPATGSSGDRAARATARATAAAKATTTARATAAARATTTARATATARAVVGGTVGSRAACYWHRATPEPEPAVLAVLVNTASHNAQRHRHFSSLLDPLGALPQEPTAHWVFCTNSSGSPQNHRLSAAARSCSIG